MTKTLNNDRFYFVDEAAKAAGISKATLLRWITKRLVTDAAKRDRNGWRLFSESEVQTIKTFAETER